MKIWLWRFEEAPLGVKIHGILDVSEFYLQMIRVGLRMKFWLWRFEETP
jgi:hypothetical protein